MNRFAVAIGLMLFGLVGFTVLVASEPVNVGTDSNPLYAIVLAVPSSALPSPPSSAFTIVSINGIVYQEREVIELPSDTEKLEIKTLNLNGRGFLIKRKVSWFDAALGRNKVLNESLEEAPMIPSSDPRISGDTLTLPNISYVDESDQSIAVPVAEFAARKGSSIEYTLYAADFNDPANPANETQYFEPSRVLKVAFKATAAPAGPCSFAECLARIDQFIATELGK